MTRIRTLLTMAAVLAVGWLWLPGSLSANQHPLEPLSAQELKESVRLVKAHFSANSLPTDKLLFPVVVLKEPPKSEVLTWLASPGTAPLPDRMAQVQVMHYLSNSLWVATVNLTTSGVTETLQATGTQAPVSYSEFLTADTVVHANSTWKTAITNRGLDPDKCYIDVWAPGDVPGAGTLKFGTATRLLRCLTFYRGTKTAQSNPPQNVYDRPVEGIVVTLDMNDETTIGGKAVHGKVVNVLDTGARPVSSESGNAATERPALKPLTITEPQGANYTRSGPDGRQIHWQNWDFFVVLHPREGIVLYDLKFNNRRVAYRASTDDIYVPYGIGDPNWIWRSAFDIGEYWLGLTAQTLVKDKDCPGNAQLISATFNSDTGGTFPYADSLAIYEQWDGLAWTRTDPSNYARDTRGARALVLYWNAWIGNYIYGFQWILRQDGSIEVVVELTGTTLNRGSVGTTTDDTDLAAPLVGKASKVAGSVGSSPAYVRAPNHQHFFNLRFDLDVDEDNNEAVRQDIVHVSPSSPGANGFDNVFRSVESPITTEGSDDASPQASRTWHVRSTSPGMMNALGEQTGYAIELPYLAFPYSEPTFAPLLRAEFASHQFWVTRYKDGELYAAGDFPNQGSPGAGLPAFVNGESVSGEDLVAWFTIGFSHVPKPEDYPVMFKEYVRARVAPHGFFDKNPTLDLPK